jgi:hypothetical protein
MAIELLNILVDELEDAAGDETLQKVLGVVDDTTLKRFPVKPNYKKSINWLTGGTNTVLTEAMMLYDIQGADHAAMTTLEIPENATLGLDYSDPSVEYVIRARNYGPGGLSVNASGAASIVNYYSLDLSTEGEGHGHYTYTSREEDVWYLT